MNLRNISLCTQEENALLIIDECLELHRKGLKPANKIFSLTLFFVMSFVCLGLIASVYGTITFCSCVFQTDAAMQNAGVIILTSGYVVYSLKLLFTLCYLNALSHRVSLKVKELIELLLELETRSSKTAYFDKVIRILWFFRGFDCNGFFTLGKPQMTSITATLVTYIIILIQFKISETSIKWDSKPFNHTSDLVHKCNLH